MTIDLKSVGHRVEPISKTYTWKDVSLYSLALGAGTEDLEFILDPSPKVLPTYGVIPAFEPVFRAAAATGGNLLQLLHTSQRIELHRPFPAKGELKTSAHVRGIWDMKVGALVAVDTETFVDGELACRTQWGMLIRGEAGFGGERPPNSLKTRPPKDATPVFEVEVPTSRDQALLYRLTGDVNPIHSHPEVAKIAGFDRPILHGLCTYGVAGRVALKHLAGNEPARFKALETKFSKVVMPGDTLVVRGYKLETPGQAAVTVTIKETGVEAIANGLFEYVP
jgi:acyl dehydratase